MRVCWNNNQNPAEFAYVIFILCTVWIFKMYNNTSRLIGGFSETVVRYTLIYPNLKSLDIKLWKCDIKRVTFNKNKHLIIICSKCVWCFQFQNIILFVTLKSKSKLFWLLQFWALIKISWSDRYLSSSKLFRWLTSNKELNYLFKKFI